MRTALFTTRLLMAINHQIHNQTMRYPVRLLLSVLILCLSIDGARGQIRLNSKAIGAMENGLKAATFSDADAARMAKEGVTWMDEHNKTAQSGSPYATRLDKLFAKHKNEGGLNLNYKVYLVKDINAFACADGSVRVFAALMDLMTDEELLAVIGHEIGHVVNHDTRDAVKQAYKQAALTEGLASQSNVANRLSGSELGKFANAMVDAKYSRKQESAADEFSYEFMKRNGYNVMAEAAAFRKLAKLSEGGPEKSKTDQMLSSHPDSEKRAQEVEKRAKKDGLFK